MTEPAVRVATEADYPALAELREAYNEEFWDRPFPPGEWRDEYYEGLHVLLAEDDGQVVGTAFGSIDHHRNGRVNFIYLRPEQRRRGAGRRLLQDLTQWFRAQGAEHVTLGVDTSNELGRTVWQRLGFVEFSRNLTARLDALEQRLAAEPGRQSVGSVHAQTDDQQAVMRAVERFVPRLFRSPATVVGPPLRGWTGVYNAEAALDPVKLRSLATELSHITGGVVLALGVEEGAAVRLVAVERGRVLDEYLSLPEHYGPLPPGDAVALRINPVVLSRLTNASQDAIRRVGRIASAPSELPPPDEQAAELAAVLGIEGALLSADEAAALDGAVRIEHS